MKGRNHVDKPGIAFIAIGRCDYFLIFHAFDVFDVKLSETRQVLDQHPTYNFAQFLNLVIEVHVFLETSIQGKDAWIL